MRWFWSQYLQDGDHEKNPLAAPLRAEDLTGLPPATIITAEFDPLRDEGEAYAARLREAGVSATATRYDGMIHGFLGMPAMFDDADAAMAVAAQALREAFGT
jgi:acetyl esterase